MDLLLDHQKNDKKATKNLEDKSASACHGADMAKSRPNSPYFCPIFEMTAGFDACHEIRLEKSCPGVRSDPDLKT